MLDTKMSSSFTEAIISSSQQKEVSLRTYVEQALQRYFARLDGHNPANVYGMVLEEMEVPLLKAVLRYTRGNQVKAAVILGLSRGTLRKKMKQYHLD